MRDCEQLDAFSFPANRTATNLVVNIKAYKQNTIIIILKQQNGTNYAPKSQTSYLRNVHCVIWDCYKIFSPNDCPTAFNTLAGWPIRGGKGWLLTGNLAPTYYWQFINVSKYWCSAHWWYLSGKSQETWKSHRMELRLETFTSVWKVTEIPGSSSQIVTSNLTTGYCFEPLTRQFSVSTLLTEPGEWFPSQK